MAILQTCFQKYRGIWASVVVPCNVEKTWAGWNGRPYFSNSADSLTDWGRHCNTQLILLSKSQNVLYFLQRTNIFKLHLPSCFY
jgi:hypothetical protein